MYNARDYILDCVNGIIGTGAPQVRAVVVDDGSTDGCGDLVRQTFGDDPRVRVISKPNGGCASARNYGRMHSDASHIAFVDADDVPGPLVPPKKQTAGSLWGKGRQSTPPSARRSSFRSSSRASMADLMARRCVPGTPRAGRMCARA